MNQPASLYSKTSSNATCCGNIYLSTSTGNDPRQGWRTPLNNIIYSEQRDEETEYNYHGARYYDADLLACWLSVDPLADKYPSMSPYNYCAWNPVKLVDPDGCEMTDFKDKNGNLINHIEDGQDVSYRVTGSGRNAHYEYERGNITAGNIDYQTSLVIQEQQKMNNDNSALQQDKSGQTYCNYATQNIQQAVESIPGNNNVFTSGRANDMAKAVSNSDNYISVSQQEALDYADQGHLVISSWENPSGGAGHVATLSVGDNNIPNHEYANIGPANYSGFVTFNTTYGKSKRAHVCHYVYMRTSCTPMCINGNQTN